MNEDRPQDDFVDPKGLRLDLANPRMPDATFDDEVSAISYLAENADVSELVQSICTSGWFDYEPLIVLKDQSVVVEGNRRLAALRIIGDANLQALTGVYPPDDAKDLPERIRVRFVATKSEARSFIGFKHINGAFRWDSLAKARYAAEWLKDGADVGDVSQQLGDNHNTILRLVNGWRVLEQAESEKLFDRSKRDKRLFAFSHLYTALTRPGAREFLGLPPTAGDLLPERPVTRDKYEALGKFTSWLYGQEGQPSVIRSQNPDLKRLVAVISNPRALQNLERTRKLDVAYDIAEDKTARFAEVVFGVIDQLDEALVLSRNYNGDEEVKATVDNIAKTARSIQTIVRQWEIDQTAIADDTDA